MMPALYPLPNIHAAVEEACQLLATAAELPQGPPPPEATRLLDSAKRMLQRLTYPEAHLREATHGEPGPLAQELGSPDTQYLATPQRFEALQHTVEPGQAGALEWRELCRLLVTRHGPEFEAERTRLQHERPGPSSRRPASLE